MTAQTLMFVAPNRPLSINEANKMHWAARRRRLEPWRTLLAVEIRNRFVKFVAPVPVVITVTLPFERRGRRDAHNYTGTMVKAIVDTLVACDVVPDDTPEWVEVTDPILAVDPERRVYVEIKVRP